MLKNMDSKKTLSTKEIAPALINNDEYFKYIFKKTEKIVSTVFYVTRSLPTEYKKDIVVVTVEARALALLDICERTLSVRGDMEPGTSTQVRVALLSLESALTVLKSARMIADDVLQVFQNELMLVHRTLAAYSPHLSIPDVFTTREKDTSLHRPQQRTQVRGQEENVARDGEKGGGVILSRGERIKAIIREKGQVTIKDISLAFSDVSEKTIQRELMSLISQGQITKTGERRWSKYTMA